jgi:hypothetical protein
VSDAASLPEAWQLLIARAPDSSGDSAYDWGILHGLALAANIVSGASALAKAKRLAVHAEQIAGEYRTRDKCPGRLDWVPEIEDRLRRWSQTGGDGEVIR